MKSKKGLSQLAIQNAILTHKSFKVEEGVNDEPRPVRHFHFCRSLPKPRKLPYIVGLSVSALASLGLDYDEVKQDPLTANYLSGSTLLEDSIPLAQNYCGHQFGGWAGQLGDGRAHMIGTVVGSSNKVVELQLKGSGKTPFSRHADGNSVLSSALRQFLASQLMHGLNIPTSRAASLVACQEIVGRDPFYNGHITYSKAAVVLRTCPTFFRFGSLEVVIPGGSLYSKNPLQNRQTILPICDYLLKEIYPQILEDEQRDCYELLFERIVRGHAELVAMWQSVGFCHGVLNTDNMSLGNCTIDYGPFAFMDYFCKDYVSNATDEHERYSFRTQPSVIKWNVNKLAQAMDCLVPTKILSRYVQDKFDSYFEEAYYGAMADKLGLDRQLKENETLRNLVDDLVDVMHICRTNFTNCFRIIETHRLSGLPTIETASKLLSQSCPTEFYLKGLRAFPQLVSVQLEEIMEHDSGFNKKFISEQAGRVELQRRIKLESCQERNLREQNLWIEWLQKYNSILQGHRASEETPSVKYVLLNHIAKQILEEAEKLDSSQSVELFQRLLSVLQQPHKYNSWFEERYWKNSPVPIKLTCSS